MLYSPVSRWIYGRRESDKIVTGDGVGGDSPPFPPLSGAIASRVKRQMPQLKDAPLDRHSRL